MKKPVRITTQVQRNQVYHQVMNLRMTAELLRRYDEPEAARKAEELAEALHTVIRTFEDNAQRRRVAKIRAKTQPVVSST